MGRGLAVGAAAVLGVGPRACQARAAPVPSAQGAGVLSTGSGHRLACTAGNQAGAAHHGRGCLTARSDAGRDACAPRGGGEGVAYRGEGLAGLGFGRAVRF